VTRTKLIAAIASSALTVPSIAWACGGGGGDSGGDSGGSSSGGDSSSSSSDSSSSSSGTTTPSCYDTTDVHGYRECTDFGAWRARRSAVAVEVGLVSSMVDLSSLSTSGDISHSDGSTYSYRIVGEDLGNDLLRPATGIALRTLVHGRHLYGGLESSFQFIDGAPAQRIYMDSGAMLSPRLTGVTSTLAVLGARRFADQLFGPLAPHGVSAGAELGAGVHMISVEADSVKGSCVTTDTSLDVSPVIAARARVDVWLSPYVSFGLWGGSDLLSRSPSAGLVISSHFRPFDGTR
jgi:hypothetical protein